MATHLPLQAASLLQVILVWQGIITSATIHQSETKPTEKDTESAELINPPQLRIDAAPISQNVRIGASITLRCEAFGRPIPTISWLKNGFRIETITDASNDVEIAANKGIKTYQEGDTTSILRVGTNTSGIDRYTCVATNRYKTVKAHAKIHVFKADIERELTSEESHGDPAHIYMFSDMRIEREDATVQLFCRAAGDPQPTITWRTVDGVAIQNDGYYEILPFGDLLIKQANFMKNMVETGGGFKCTATNAHGSDSVDVFFYPSALKLSQ